MRPSSPRFTESRSSAKGGLAQYRRRCSRLLAIDTQLGNKERDADAGINGKPAVLPGEHVGGGSGVEETLPKIGQPSAHLNYPATLNSFRSCLKVIDTFRHCWPSRIMPVLIRSFPTLAKRRLKTRGYRGTQQGYQSNHSGRKRSL